MFGVGATDEEETGVEDDTEHGTTELQVGGEELEEGGEEELGEKGMSTHDQHIDA